MSSETTYTVQRERTGVDFSDAGVGAGYTVWEDVATVCVPPKTKRATVIKQALQEAGVTVEVGEPLRVRVLDVESARVATVNARQVEPELEIT